MKLIVIMGTTLLSVAGLACSQASPKAPIGCDNIYTRIFELTIHDKEYASLVNQISNYSGDRRIAVGERSVDIEMADFSHFFKPGNEFGIKTDTLEKYDDLEVAYGDKVIVRSSLKATTGQNYIMFMGARKRNFITSETFYYQNGKDKYSDYGSYNSGVRALYMIDNNCDVMDMYMTIMQYD